VTSEQFTKRVKGGTDSMAVSAPEDNSQVQNLPEA